MRARKLVPERFSLFGFSGTIQEDAKKVVGRASWLDNPGLIRDRIDEALETLGNSPLNEAARQVASIAADFTRRERSSVRSILGSIAEVERDRDDDRIAPHSFYNQRRLLSAELDVILHDMRDLVGEHLGTLPPELKPASALSKPASTSLAAPPRLAATRLEGVRVNHRQTTHLDVESLSIDPGTVTGIVGRVGAGKTTLLRLLALQDQPTTGSIAFPLLKARGLREAQIADQISWVPDTPSRFAGSTRTMLLQWLLLRLEDKRYAFELVDFALARFDLLEHADKSFEQLSSGMHTQIRLARESLQPRQMIVLDEPLASLDSRSRRTFMADMRLLSRSAAEPAIVLSSHDLESVDKVCDRVIVLDNGRVVADLTSRALAGHIFELFIQPKFHSELVSALVAGGAKEVTARSPELVRVRFENSVSIARVATIAEGTGCKLHSLSDISNSSVFYVDPF